MSPREQRTSTGRWLWWILAVLGVVMAGAGLVSQRTDARENVAGQCLIVGTTLGAGGDDGTLIEARSTTFPPGRLCVWRLDDGTTKVDQSGWIAGGIAVIGSLGCVALFFAPGSARPRSWLIALLPTICACAIWGALILGAHSATV